MKRILSLVVILVLTLSPTASAPVAAASTLFSGQATAVDATVAGTHVALADTGPLPSSGGALDASQLEANVPGVLTADVLHAATAAQGDHARAESAVADVHLTAGGNDISAGFLMSRASATCNGGKASVSGSSEIVSLTINGQTVTVSGQANQTVALPNGSVVLNEQSTGSSANGSGGQIDVTALHVIVTGLADVAIAKAHADIVCGGQTCDRDFITGGGWITTAGRDSFAVAGGVKSGSLAGHLEYIDHANGLKVHGTAVTAYAVTGTTSRHIEGTAMIGGSPGTYQVDVADNGEPGSADTFRITLSTGYTASGTLGGGNIQLHTCK